MDYLLLDYLFYLWIHFFVKLIFRKGIFLYFIVLKVDFMRIQVMRWGLVMLRGVGFVQPWEVLVRFII